MPQRHHEVRPEEQMHLADLHDLDRVDVPGRSQHHEHGAPVEFQLGPLVGVDGVLDSELV